MTHFSTKVRMANRDMLRIVAGFKGPFFFLSPESEPRIPLARLPLDKQAAADKVAVAIRERFKNPELKAKLLATGTANLLHINGRGDQFWGVCGGQGLNVYGKLLMAVRDQIRIEEPAK